MRSKSFVGAVFAGLSLTGLHAAHASETVVYSYDAQGRIIDAAHSGSGPNSGLDIAYQYDLTNNRTTQTVTGSKNNGQQVVVVPMGSGFTIIPINP